MLVVAFCILFVWYTDCCFDFLVMCLMLLVVVLIWFAWLLLTLWYCLLFIVLVGGRVDCLLILLHRWLRFVLLSSVGLLYLCGLLVVNYLDCLYFWLCLCLWLFAWYYLFARFSCWFVSVLVLYWRGLSYCFSCVLCCFVILIITWFICWFGRDLDCL